MKELDINGCILATVNRLKIPKLDIPKFDGSLNENLNVWIQAIVWQSDEEGYLSDPIPTESLEDRSSLTHLAHIFYFLGLEFKGNEEENGARLFFPQSSVDYLINPENEKLNYVDWMAGILKIPRFLVNLEKKDSYEVRYRNYLKIHESFQCIEHIENRKEEHAQILHFLIMGNGYNELSLKLSTPDELGAQFSVPNSVSNAYYIKATFCYLDFLMKIPGDKKELYVEACQTLRNFFKDHHLINLNLIKRTEEDFDLRLQYYQCLSEALGEKIYQAFYQYFFQLEEAQKHEENKEFDQAKIAYLRAIEQLRPYENEYNSLFKDACGQLAYFLYEKDHQTQICMTYAEFTSTKAKEGKPYYGYAVYEINLYTAEQYEFDKDFKQAKEHYLSAIEAIKNCQFDLLNFHDLLTHCYIKLMHCFECLVEGPDKEIYQDFYQHFFQLQEAQKYERNKDFDRAKLAYLKSIEKLMPYEKRHNSLFQSCCGQLAYLLYKKDHQEQAYAEFKLPIVAEPYYVYASYEILLYTAGLDEVKGNFERAKKRYFSAIEAVKEHQDKLLNSKDLLNNCYVKWVHCLYKGGWYKEAAKFCLTILKTRPQLDAIKILRAKSLIKDDKLGPAKKILEELLPKDKAKPSFERCLLLGEIALKESQYEKSKEYYSQALECREDWYDEKQLYYQLALVSSYFNKNDGNEEHDQNSEALKYYIKAFPAEPDAPIVYARLVHAYFYSMLQGKQPLEEKYVKFLIKGAVAYATKDAKTLDTVITMIQGQERCTWSDFYLDLIAALNKELHEKLQVSALLEKLGKSKKGVCQSVVEQIVVLCQKTAGKNGLRFGYDVYKALIFLLAGIEPHFLEPARAVEFCLKSIQGVPGTFEVILEALFSATFFYQLGNKLQNKDSEGLEKAWLCYSMAEKRMEPDQEEIPDLSNQLFWLSLQLNKMEEEDAKLRERIQAAVQDSVFCKKLVVFLKEKELQDIGKVYRNKILDGLIEILPKEPFPHALLPEVYALRICLYFKQGQYALGLSCFSQAQLEKLAIELPTDKKIAPYQALFRYCLKQNPEVYSKLLPILGQILDKTIDRQTLISFCLQVLGNCTETDMVHSIVTLLPREDALFKQLFIQLPIRAVEFCLKSIQSLPDTFEVILGALFSATFFYQLGNKLQNKDSEDLEKAWLCYHTAERMVSDQEKIPDLSNQLFWLSLQLNKMEEEDAKLRERIQAAVQDSLFCEKLIVFLKEKNLQDMNAPYSHKVLDLLIELLPQRSSLFQDVYYLRVHHAFKEGQYELGMVYFIQGQLKELPVDKNIKRYEALFLYCSQVNLKLLPILGQILDNTVPRKELIQFCWQLLCHGPDSDVVHSIVTLLPREDALFKKFFYQLPKNEKSSELFFKEIVPLMTSEGRQEWAVEFNRSGKNRLTRPNRSNKPMPLKPSHYKSVLKLLKMADALHPNYPPILYNLGVTYFKLEEYEQAKACFQSLLSCLENGPKSYEVLTDYCHHIAWYLYDTREDKLKKPLEKGDETNLLKDLALNFLKKNYQKKSLSFWEKDYIRELTSKSMFSFGAFKKG